MNIDWSVHLSIRRNRLLYGLCSKLLSAERLDRLSRLPDNIVVHDLTGGIPYANDSVDIAYHSHFLEHLDREAARGFLDEVRRVLKKGGIHRIVVPDWELACRRYLRHTEECALDDTRWPEHDQFVRDMLEQSVRRESHGTSQQGPLQRLLENTLLGDARRRGETHQWAYDRYNLSALLLELGYAHVAIHSFKSSSIPNWRSYNLDEDTAGEQYKPDSLYIEAIK